MERALHVRADELGRTVDRTIDVRFGGKMDDRLGLVFGENALDGGLIDDVSVDKDMARIVERGAQGIQIARISQFVQIHDPDRPFGDALPDETAPDKSSAAGDKNGVHRRSIVIHAIGVL